MKRVSSLVPILPAEILHHVFSLLDLTSLVRLYRAHFFEVLPDARALFRLLAKYQLSWPVARVHITAVSDQDYENEGDSFLDDFLATASVWFKNRIVLVVTSRLDFEYVADIAAATTVAIEAYVDPRPDSCALFSMLAGLKSRVDRIFTELVLPRQNFPASLRELTCGCRVEDASDLPKLVTNNPNLRKLHVRLEGKDDQKYPISLREFIEEVRKSGIVDLALDDFAIGTAVTAKDESSDSLVKVIASKPDLERLVLRTGFGLVDHRTIYGTLNEALRLSALRELELSHTFSNHAEEAFKAIDRLAIETFAWASHRRAFNMQHIKILSERLLHSRIRNLSLNFMGADCDGPAIVSEITANGIQLEQLTLRGLILESKFEVHHMPRLQRLEISQNLLVPEDEIFAEFVDPQKWTRLREVDISRNDIDDDGLERIAAQLAEGAFHSVKSLDLTRNCYMGDRGLHAIAVALPATRIERLSLDMKLPSNAGTKLKAVIDAIPQTRLCHLNLVNHLSPCKSWTRDLRQRVCELNRINDDFVEVVFGKASG